MLFTPQGRETQRMFDRIAALWRKPTAVTEMEYLDPETGQAALRIRTSPRYTVIQTPDREYYFVRGSGHFDGAGAMSLDDPLPLNGLRAERVRRSRLARERSEPASRQ